MSLNKVLRGRKSFASGDFFSSQKTSRSPLKGIQKHWVPFICSIPCLLGFILPVFQLLYWASFHLAYQFSIEHLVISFQSLIIASVAAFITVFFSVALVYFPKWNRIKSLNQLIKVSTVGYIIPGAVIGITLVASSSYLVNVVAELFQLRIGYLVYSSIYILIFAYLFRFLAVSYNPIEAHALRIGNELSESSYLLGKSKLVTFFKVDSVLLRNSFLTGFLIVFIDVMKELPLTLLLKPYHIQTLAIKAFEFADDERVSEAALPSLTLIVVVCLAMLLISKFRND